MARIVTIIGTRPEIIKMTPVVKALDQLPHEHVLVHSGQHYDLVMDRIFFKEMDLRDPDYQFELRDQPPHLQIAKSMRQMAPVVKDADLVVVHGDTNTTVAGALLANKLGRRLAHVEAGLRSFDRSMPEEINRTIADHLSDLLFAPTETSRQNLRRENVSSGVHVVGNSVIDSMKQYLPLAENRRNVLEKFGLKPRRYVLLTFHRAETVDRKDRLETALKAFEAVAREIGSPIIFPIHPRTRDRIKRFGLEGMADRIEAMRRVEPTGYLDMLVLEKNAALIMTDSGGLQEEACFLKIPCVTLRSSTERPETLDAGANMIAGTDPAAVVRAVALQLAAKREWANPFGDGQTGIGIARSVDSYFSGRPAHA